MQSQPGWEARFHTQTSSENIRIVKNGYRNAEDLALNGFCITPDKRLAGHLPGIVAIEGGPKYTKFFKKLLLNRLKWDDSKDIKKHDTLGENFNDEKMVQLVWEGAVELVLWQQEIPTC